MVKNLLLWLVIAAVLLSVFNNFNMQSQSEQVGYSELISEVQADQVKKVVIDGLTISGERYDGSRFETIRPMVEDPKLIDDLLEHNVEVVGRKPEQQSVWTQLLVASFPILIIIAVFMFFMRQMQGGAGGRGGPMSFGKSKARLLGEDQITTTFADVAGVDEAKEDVKELVEFLRDPSRFQKLGGRIPRGVLMVGQPGTGKTLLAKAIAGEAKVPFFSISGSDFVEMFVGVGASRVRDMFDQAKKQAPCIIFIDEIDAVGRHRGAGLGGGHDEREQTLNQILVEMDGFDTDTHVIILAATNRPDILDPALLRPGRFDRRVVFDRPDMRGREAIFRVHVRGKPLANAVDIGVLAKATPGFVGADIENTVNEAALLAARRNKKSIGMNEFQEAIERVQLGPERRSRIMSPEEKELTAYHEAGHAMVSHFLPHAQTLRKITIIPRGMAGGVTWYMDEDTSFLTRSKFEAMIATALGGRVAEEIVFGEITTGASNDLQQVTRIARAMVTQYGMSTELGLRVYGEKQELVFLGREISEQRDYSDAIAEQIDTEVRRIIDLAHQLATDILTGHRDKLDLVSQKLLEVETLEAVEFVALMEGKDLPTSPPSGSSKVSPTPKANEASERHRPSLDLPPSPSPA